MKETSVFSGGVRLEPNKVATQLPTPQLPPQPLYAVPLNTRGGQFAEPRVQVGDAVLGGQLIAGARSKVGAHSPVSGLVKSVQTENNKACIVIEADGLQQKIPARPPVHPASVSIDDLREAGLTGMGGAGFPTADKLQAAGLNKPKMLLINAVECEPLISCDAQLIAEDAKTILFGADWLRQFSGAYHCQIVLEDHSVDSHKILTTALSDSDFDAISISTVPTRYPAGSERQLVHAITGTALLPGERPLDKGVLVQNIGTVHALGHWAQDGTPLTKRLVTVAGNACPTPQTLWCPIGTPVAALVEYVGATEKNVDLFQGGPVMGQPLSDATAAVSKHMQCLRIEIEAKKPEAIACIRCGDCAEACPEHLLPQQLHWQLQGDNLPGAQAERLPDCILCGCCDLVCPSLIPLSKQFAAGKSALRLRQHTELRAAKAKTRFDARELRLEEKERERQERMKKRKAGTAKTDKQKAVAEAMARARAKRAEKAGTSKGDKDE